MTTATNPAFAINTSGLSFDGGMVVPPSAGRQTVSKQRVADFGEVFTAEREVNAMLDLVKPETERIESRFLEPACGTGNFLAEILRRKLTVVKNRYAKSQVEYQRYALLAVSSLYGIDILADSVELCRQRLFDLFHDFYRTACRQDCPASYAASVLFLLEKNIVLGDALTLKRVDRSDLPIVFSEWSPVNGCQIKRRDFTFAELTQPGTLTVETLFQHFNVEAFIPKPLKEYPPTHYLELANEPT